MLDAERLIEAEFVAQLQFAPELLVAFVRGHSGLGPDVGEVSKFHGVTAVADTLLERPVNGPGITEGSCAAARTLSLRYPREYPVAVAWGV
jgi:hypothetical protein